MEYRNLIYRVFERWVELSGGQKRFVIVAGSALSLLSFGALWAGITLGSGGSYTPPFSWTAIALTQQVIWFLVMLLLQVKTSKQ